MINWKIKYLRLKIKSKGYYSERLNKLVEHKNMLDERFRIAGPVKEDLKEKVDQIMDIFNGKDNDSVR